MQCDYFRLLKSSCKVIFKYIKLNAFEKIQAFLSNICYGIADNFYSILFLLFGEESKCFLKNLKQRNIAIFATNNFCSSILLFPMDSFANTLFSNFRNKNAGKTGNPA